MPASRGAVKLYAGKPVPRKDRLTCFVRSRSAQRPATTRMGPLAGPSEAMTLR